MCKASIVASSEIGKYHIPLEKPKVKTQLVRNPENDVWNPEN